MKLSKLYGMPIESENKKTRGYILGISCADGAIGGYICCNEREKEFFASAEGSYLSEGKMVFKNRGTEGENTKKLRLGRAVYDKNGAFCGLLTECTLKGTDIVFAKVGKQKIAFERLICGDVFILKDDEEI